MSEESTEPAASDSSGAQLVPGSKFAGLIVEAEIGRGGMGVIYRVRDPELDRVRALKVLPPERSRDAEFRERFRRESRQAAAIEHSNVTQVLRAGQEGDRLYLLMRFVDGPSLGEVLAERGRVDLHETIAIVRQVAAALDAAHANGLVHRDVKPANVLLEGDGDARRAFLCDFGISKIVDAGTRLTKTGQFVGTVDYVAPEQLEGGEVDGRADIYSLACLAFHMLTGAPPFARETQLATMFAHANAPRPRAEGPGLSHAVEEVLQRAMSVDPARRYSSAGQFADQLSRAAAHAGEAQTTQLAVARGPRRWLIVATALVALAAAAVAFVLASDDGSNAGPLVTTRSFEVAPRPLGVVVGPGRVWVASPASGTATALPLSDPAGAEEHMVGAAPTAAAIGWQSVWLADREDDALVRIDPVSGSVEARIGVGADPADVEVAHDAVWVANSGDDSVSRVSPERGAERVVDTIPVGRRPVALAADQAGVWVANRDGPSVSYLDADASRVSGKPVEVGQRPNDIAVGSGYAWVTDNFTGTVTQIDLDQRRVNDDPIDVGALPRAIAFGAGRVWVANGEDGTVSVIDPASGSVVGDPIRVGAQPADIGAGSDSVWTANFGDSTVSELRLSR